MDINFIFIYFCFHNKLYFIAVAEIDHIHIDRSMFIPSFNGIVFPPVFISKRPNEAAEFSIILCNRTFAIGLIHGFPADDYPEYYKENED